MDGKNKEKILTLSIVVPLYNEAENISEFYSRLKKVLDEMSVSYEIICINDGSTDNTLDELLKLNNQFFKEAI